MLPLVLLGSWSPCAARGQSQAESETHLRYDRMALAFEGGANAKSIAQTYTAHGMGFDLVLTGQNASLLLNTPVNAKQADGHRASSKVDIEFAGSRTKPRVEAEIPLGVGYNYFQSRDPQKWRTNVPLFGQVRYPGVYRGIDLVFHGKQDHLEYDFLVRSGANPDVIRLNMKGAQQIDVDGRGDLVLEVDGQDVRFRKPVAYQGEGLARRPVEVSYALSEGSGPMRNGVGFTVGAYDHAKPLVIDPVLEYGRYVGKGWEQVAGVAADLSGAAYVVSGSGTGSFTVRKFATDGNLERSATVALADLRGRVQGTAIAVSASGAVYVSGFAGPGLPTGENAAQGFSEGGTKAFLAVFEPKDSSLTLKYLSYLGGASSTSANGLAVDSSGAAYLVGDVSAGEFPTTRGAFQAGLESNLNSTAFLCKVDPRLTGANSIVYATLLGNGGQTHGIATDAMGNAYVVRDWDGAIAGTAGAYGSSSLRFDGNSIEVTKLNAAGSGVIYSANFGPGYGTGIAVDGSGAAYITGVALPEGLPASRGAYQSEARGGFVMKLNAAGSELEFVTYLGGTGSVEPRSIAIEPGCMANCEVDVTGVTSAGDFPSIHPVQAVIGAVPSVFAVRVAGDGASAKYSTFLGGITSSAAASKIDDKASFLAGPSVAIDGLGFAHVAGNLAANVAQGDLDFPVTVLGPVGGAFLARIGDAEQPHLVAVPATVNFGTAFLNDVPSTATVVLRNMGSAEAALQPIEVGPSGEFEASDNCGSRLAGGASCVVSIQFFPASVGERAGTLSIRSGDESPLTISMAGRGAAAIEASNGTSARALAQAAAPAVSGTPMATLNPASLSYGNRVVGAGGVTLASTLTNTGTATLSIASVVLSGVNASQFAFTAPAPAGVCNPNILLAVGASCTISVKYTPTVMGTASAVVTITDNAGNSPQTLGLSGTATGYPVPFTQQLSPLAATPGSSSFPLTVQGVQLASGAVVKWNGTSLTTSVTSATQATATVPASLLTAAGTGMVTVTNPKPTGVLSNPIYIPVANAIGTLSFNSSLFPALTVNKPVAVLTIDVNGDYKADVVVLDALDGQVQTFTNAGSGRLTLKSTVTVGASPAAVAAGDFNEDGKLDLAVVNGNGTVSILTGDGTGNYSVSSSFSSGSQGQAIVAGDFNGDGHLDLAVLNSGTSNVELFLGNGAGTFTLASTTAVGVSPYGLVPADYNHDGYLDLAAGNGDGTVTVLLGNGAGGLSAAATVTTGVPADGIATADFNEDGVPDLAVAGTNGTISILTGNGTGNFVTAAPVIVNSPATSIVAGDFNGNGHVGLAVGMAGTGQAAIYFGTGRATFNAGPVLTTVAGPTALAAADLNSDGYPDLVVASSGSNSVQLQYQESLAVVTPASINFLPQLVGTQSQSSAVTITNSGSIGLTISSISINPSSNTGANDFAQTNTCGSLPATLASGASCTLNVTFTPSKLTNESATLGISDSSGGTSAVQHVALAGTGVSVYTTQASINAPAIVTGANAQITATVTGANGVPAGNVTLTVGSNAPVTQALSGGSTIFSVPGLAANSYHLALSYAAQGNYAASSASGTLVVNSATTTSSIVAAPVSYGQSAQIAVTVSSAGGQPTGTVTLAVGSNAPITQSLAAGVATFIVPGLTAGQYALTASYAGQGSFTPSSASGNQTVNQAVPSTSWATPAPITWGTALSGTQLDATASVAGTFLYSPAAGAILGIGNQTLTATFAPQDSVDYTAASASTTITVAPAATSTALSAPAITYGSFGTVNVFVTSQYGTPTGIVSLQVGANAPLSQPLSSGVAAFAVPGLTAGSYAITASYVQQNSYAASSATGTLVVNQAVPVLQWAKPLPIPTAVPLSSTQLNATAPVPGSFAYSPAAGAILGIGANQTLSAVFTPTDTVDYTSATISTMINVTANPVPYVNAVIPSAMSPAAVSAGFTLNLTGTGFVPTSTVKLNGTVLVSTTTGSTSLAATVPPSLTTNFGLSLIKVANPELTKGGLSNVLPLPITNPYSSLTFGPVGSTPPAVNQPIAMVAGQFDSTGNQDLAIVDALDGTVQIYLGNGAGVFTYYVSVPVGANPVSITTGDFNEDGRIDLAVANANGNVTILQGNGAGYFSVLSSFSAGRSAQFIAAADLNLDGHLDLAVVNPGGTTVTVFVGTGTASFTQASQLTTGVSPYGLVISDLNVDGYPDIAVGNGDGTVSVYLGNGTGNFFLASSPATGSPATAIATGDFNEDKLPDLAVVNSNGNVSILTGGGNGTFTNGATAQVGTTPQAIAVGDLNGDGHLDLVVANQGSNNVTVLLGSGTGTFAPQPAVPAGSSPVAVAVDDFNGDGREDIATANSSTNTVSVLFQIPTAAVSTQSLTFGSPVAGVATPAQTVTVSDNGSGPLTITGIAIAPGTNAGANDFTQTNTCGTLPAVIAPGASCTISVSLTASTASAESATLTITDNSNLVAGSAQTVGLSDTSAIVYATQTTLVPGPSIVFGGAATATITVTSPSGTPTGNVTLAVDAFPPLTKALSNGSASFQLTGLLAGSHQLTASFANQGSFGSSSAAGSIAVAQASPTITWPAPAAITAGTPLSAVQLNAASNVAGRLVYSPAPGTVLGVGNNQALSVTFTPVDTADYTSASGASSISVVASSSAVYTAPASLTFNNQTDGFSSPTQTATLFNSGTSSITVKGISIGGTSYASYSTFTIVTGTNSCAVSSTIAIGGNCAISVHFKPTTIGAFAGTLTLTYTVGTATKSTSLTVPLAGNGLATPIPLVEPVAPATVLPGNTSAGFTLLVPAADYTSSSVVSMNGLALATQLVTSNGATRLSATVPAGMVTTQSTGILAVANAKPTGLLSNPGYVSFTNPLAQPHFSLGPFSAETANQPIAILVQDINGDHIPDLVALDALDGTIISYIGAGSGRVVTNSTVKVGANPVAFVAGDFNEDGKLDLAVASSNGNVTILLGNGSGNYTVQTPFSVGSSAQSIGAADLNGDGHWDLVVTNPATNTAAVLFGTGTGTFTAQPPLATGVSPYGAVIADFNLDGIPDVAVGNADGSISVFLGAGSGTLLPGFTPVTGAPASSIATGDFNEDGIPDLAVINTNNTVSVLTGSGTGSFTLGYQGSVGNTPQGLFVADLNGDGHLDLAVANTADSTVSLLYGTGTGTFAAQVVTPVAANPLAIGAADMNNDGRVDLSVSSGGTNSVSVLMQNPLTVISASSLSFGSALYGTTTASQTLTISNSGSGPLSVTYLGIHPGYESADFSMTTTCPAAPMIINPQTSCTATISYTPSRVGAESATFQVTDNSDSVGMSVHYVSLSGTGLAVPTTITISSPGTIVYGSTGVVSVGITTPTTVPPGLITLSVGSNAPLTQRLSTTGTASFQLTGLPAGTYPLIVNYASQFWYAPGQAVGTLTVQPATPTVTWAAPASITQGTPLTSAQLNASSPVEGSYAYNPPASTVLSAGNNQSLYVTFTPTDTADYTSVSASTTINVLPASSSATLTQSGLTFGAQTIGTSSATQTATLINSGSSPVVLSGISITGTNQTFFQFVSPAPATSCLNAGGTLAVGASCTLDVFFNPSAAGAASANIVITDNAGSGSQVVVLSGLGAFSATPFVGRISPNAVAPSVAAAGFTLSVNGTGFASGSTISINGQAVPTTVTNATAAQAQIPAGLIAVPETVTVAVVNPGPGGDTVSNPVPLPITNPTSNVMLGTGPFAPLTVNTPQQVAVADFNGDGIPDVAVADSQDGEVLVYLGSASGALTLKSTLTVGAGPISMTVGDFNEDQKLDLAVLSSSGNISIWLGDGTGNFAAGATTSAGTSGDFITTADLNGDGHLDLAAVNPLSQTVAILLGSGTGTFAYTATLYTGVSPYGAALADFNQDGILDLAVGNADGTVAVFQGNGNGTFNLVTTFETGSPATALAAGDFNEDGILDIAVVNTGFTGVGTNGAVSVWTGSGNGLFTQATQVTVGNNPDALVVADFNGDGHLDVAVANQLGNTVQVLIGTGGARFNALNAQAAGTSPVALGAGDFNGDGRLDIVAADGGSNFVAVLLQIPQAALSSPSLLFPTQTIGTPSTPQSFTITNSGTATAPLVISGISITPAYNTAANDFTWTTYCGTLPASLAPGSSCTVNVTFSPSYVALENAVLTVTDNSGGLPGSTQTVALSGTAPLPTNILATSQINLAPTLTIPSNFLGLSFDWNTAESWMGSTSTGADPIFAQLLSNLMAYNSGPFVIRTAGDSVDTGTINATTVVPFAQLAQNMNVHYILGVNLDLQNLSLAESQAAAYAAGVPNGSIDGFEIGNEPDNYLSTGARGEPYGVSAYLAERSTWQQGIAAAVPSLQRFVDPALASSGWLSGIESAVSTGGLPVNIVTQHSYVACKNTANPWPTNLMLQPYATTSAPKLYGPFAAIAHQAGEKFRMGEMNSICSGGQAGLSNNFTTALWSIDTMFAFANAGIDGVNWHTSQGAAYNAFNLNVTTKSGMNQFAIAQINPLYYGLLMFAQAAGNGAQLLPVTTLTNANLDVWATLDNSGIVHLVIINKDQVASGTLQFSVPGYNSGTAIPLTASSYAATNGVTIGGQTFDGSTTGAIQGTQVTQTVTPTSGVFSISVNPTSAVLINLTH